jgi:hypothetical protein
VEELLNKPNHSYTLKQEDCLAQETKIAHIDISTVKVDDLESIAQPFEFKVMRSGTLHGFCTWFQVDFAGLSPEVNTTFLNTGPDYE